MDFGPDEIAGVVDVFGALPPATLRDGLAELAFKRGEECDPADFDSCVQAAVDGYHLVELDMEGTPLVVPGPVAFPAPPEDATDLHHILDAAERTVDPERRAEAAERRFRQEAGEAVAEGDDDRIRELLDVSYELEAWAPADLADARDRLTDSLEGN